MSSGHSHYVIVAGKNLHSTTNSAGDTDARLTTLEGEYAAMNKALLALSAQVAALTPSILPGPPQSLHATPGSTQVVLTWLPPASNGGSAITGYRVYQGGSLIASPSGTTDTVTGLTNGTTYSFTVSAVTANGEGPQCSPVSSTPVASPTVPGAPTLNSATAGNAQVTLAITLPGSNGGSPLTGLKVYRGTSSGAETLLATIGLVTSYTDSTVTNGTAYFYKVSALNAVGESALSGEKSATPTSTYTFEDLFPGSSLDTSKWIPLYGIGDPGDRADTDMGNFGLTKVTVSGGVASLHCDLQSTPSGRPYAGASICTRTKFSQTYGTFLCDVQYPAGQGIWPALWLLAEGPSVVTPPEIDVFESYPGDPSTGGSGVDVFIPAIHTVANPARSNPTYHPPMTNTWHTWKIVWSATRLEYFIDGTSCFVVTTDIPNVPMYLILTYGIGVGGTAWRADSTTPAHSQMNVRNVRVLA